MKLQLIMTEPPIVVEEEQIHKGDYYFLFDKIIKCSDSLDSIVFYNGITPVNPKKIIAGLPTLPSIDFSLISEEKLKEVGYVDVEKLAKNIYQPELSSISLFAGDLAIPKRKAFIKGFNFANQLNNKKYSEEDVEKAFNYARRFRMKNVFEFDEFTDFKKIINQPRVYDIEVEMERVRYPKDEGWEDVYYPKITNNSIKVLKIN